MAAGALLLSGRGECAQTSDDANQIGQALDRLDFLPDSFAARFETMPAFRRGGVISGPTRPLTDPAFAWTAGYIHTVTSPTVADVTPQPGRAPAFASLPHELEAYPNADAIELGRYNPFSIVKGALVITADRTPETMRPLIPEPLPNEYVSGAFCSFPFGQKYGYFELRGRVPAGRGLWPTFWLLPTDRSWPPELDVMEVLGDNPRKLHTTTHSKRLADGTYISRATDTVDLSLADHDFGVDWGPAQIRYYLDRCLVFAHPTPVDCHKPFYLLANLGVGGPGSWPGPPDANTAFPAHFSIVSICAWQRAAYV